MFNRRILGFTVFCAGALCLAWGLLTSVSFEEVSEMTGGSPRQESVWYIILGLIGVIAGGYSFVRDWRRRARNPYARD